MLNTTTVDNDEIALALCCKAGINRSVGFCAIFAFILDREGFEVHKVWLSQSVMTHRRICMDCNFCKTGSEDKHEKMRAFEDAVRLWRSI